MNVLLGQFNIPGQQPVFGAGGTTGNGVPTNASDYPLPYPTTGPLQEQPLTSGAAQRQLCHQRQCHRGAALSLHRRGRRLLRQFSASAAS